LHRALHSKWLEKTDTAVSEAPDAKMQIATAFFFVVSAILLQHDATDH
jgi:hypothetical protein